MLEELKKNIEEFIEDSHSLIISNEPINVEKEFKKRYNSLIKKEVKDKAGVYIWENDETEEIIYIGMAGRINNEGELKSHSLEKRLRASRGKNTNGKYVLTNAFIFGLLNNPKELLMKNYENIKPIKKIKINICYSKQNIPSTYLESILLYQYFIKCKKLPVLNNSF
jgi:hypothetical protein